MILATVSSDSSFHGDVYAALERHFRFDFVWDLGYQDAARLQGVKSDEKCLTIVDFTNPAPALLLAQALGRRPQITAIAVGCGDSRDELLRLMQAGIRDVLPHFTTGGLLDATKRALAVLGGATEVLADLYSFLPAKPGCGATTTATHAAGLAARMAGEPILLMDFDIRLGVTTFLLKAEGTRTIQDALRMVDLIDRDMWSSLVAQLGNLHLLGSGAGDFSRAFPPQNFRQLLDYAVRQYSVIAIDLPGAMEEYECDVLLRSKRIMLVCTPDIGALHVARRKCQWFLEMQLTDRVSIVLNCVERRSTLSVKEIERIVQLPVHYLLPAGAKDLAKTVHKGEILDARCPLGKQIAAIAADMVPVKSLVDRPSPMRRFVDYFSVSPARGVGSA